MTSGPLHYTYLDSPIGALLLAGDETALHYLSFPGGHKAFPPKAGWLRDDACLAEAKRQLRAYFAGDLTEFDLPLAMAGTEFQRTIWAALRSIPYGETRSYGWLAKAIGSPAASRAVGAANGANPIPIIVPCHRVIGSNGALTGFGGGIETKRHLLQHERQAVRGGQLSLL